MRDGGDSSLGSLLSLLGFALMKTKCVWMDTICHAHLTSSRLLAFSERVFFQTPYFQGDIQLENRLPASIKLQDRTEVLLHAEMSIPDTPPTVEYQEWEGPIFLPNNRGKFFALLAGKAEIYPFSPKTDGFEIKPSGHHHIFQQLIESNFACSVWSLRSSSRHAKSKTYKRDFD